MSIHIKYVYADSMAVARKLLNRHFYILGALKGNEEIWS
jgi:hypothetical protein